jgi:hypothetical protein
MPSHKPNVQHTFKTVILANQDFGQINYIGEDASYRPQPIDDLLTILWHPQKCEVVGVKLNHVALFATSHLVLSGQGDRPLPFKRLLDYALEHAINDSGGSEEEDDLRKKFYTIAKEVVGNAKISNKKLRAVVSF